MAKPVKILKDHQKKTFQEKVSNRFDPNNQYSIILLTEIHPRALIDGYKEVLHGLSTEGWRFLPRKGLCYVCGPLD